jgi:hypothetical protein
VDDPDFLESLKHVQSIYLLDDSQSVVGENDSPDISFRFSLNPHRGCRHGCSYCYARPTYEYLGMNSGIDFESKMWSNDGRLSYFERFSASLPGSRS